MDVLFPVVSTDFPWYMSKVEKPMKGFIKGSSEFTKFI